MRSDRLPAPCGPAAPATVLHPGCAATAHHGDAAYPDCGTLGGMRYATVVFRLDRLVLRRSANRRAVAVFCPAGRLLGAAPGGDADAVAAACDAALRAGLPDGREVGFAYPAAGTVAFGAVPDTTVLHGPAAALPDTAEGWWDGATWRTADLLFVPAGPLRLPGLYDGGQLSGVMQPGFSSSQGS